jgi:hypothetical protein
MNGSAESQNDDSDTLPAFVEDVPVHSGSHDIVYRAWGERDARLHPILPTRVLSDIPGPNG